MDLEVCFVENGLVLVGVLELCQKVQEGGWQLWVNKAYSNSSRGVTPPPDQDSCASVPAKWYGEANHPVLV